MSRFAQAKTALTKPKLIWRDITKITLVRSIVNSIFMYAWESLTLTAELEKRTQAFEMPPNVIEQFVEIMLPMRGFTERPKQPLEIIMNSRH